MNDDTPRIVEGIINLSKPKHVFRIGDVVEWLDQGSALIVGQCEILDPIHSGEYDLYAANPTSWPRESGWVIKLRETGEIIEVHEETLEVIN